MKNLPVSNEMKLKDLVIIVILAFIAFTLHFRVHSEDYTQDFKDLNTRFDNLEKFLKEPIETNFTLKKNN